MSDKQYFLVRDYVAGSDLKQQKICGICGDFASKEVLFLVQGDMSVIERYCATCSQAVVKESKKNTHYL
jgi:hypothetical protein